MSEPKHAQRGTELSGKRSNEKLETGECLSCRVIGTVSLGAVGLYALQQSRARAPGSILGKRIMAGVGVCEFLSSCLDTAPFELRGLCEIS